VDSANGSDSNPGTLAKPWQTVAKVNATTLSPGQSVGFKAGDMWRESLIPGQSGRAGAPITFTSYGVGANPILNGANLLPSGWTKYATDVWQVANTTQPSGVYFDDSPGVPVVSAAAIVAPYEWYWASNILYVWAPGNISPATTYTSPGVEAAARNLVISVDTKSYINIANLTATKGNQNVLKLNSATYFRATNCEFLEGTWAGVNISNGSHHLLFDGGTIHHNGRFFSGDGDGIGFGNQDAASHDIIVQNMDIYANGLNGLGNNVSSSLTSTLEAPYNILIQHNTIRDSPSADGIFVFGGTGITIQYNLILNNAKNGFESYNGDASWPTIDVFLYNNTIVGNGAVNAYGVNVGNIAGVTNVTSKNNIVCCNASGAYGGVGWYNPRSGANLTSDYNDVYNTTGANAFYYQGAGFIPHATWKTDTGQDTNSKSANPLFTNAGAGDYTLRGGSPAIGAGLYIPGVSAVNPPNMGAK
jgi:hypothetical protein